MIQGETLYSVATAIEKATGRRPHPSTAHRWRLRREHPLETWKVGGRRMTSVEAVIRFIEAVTAAADSQPPESRIHLRRAAADDAERELAKKASRSALVRPNCEPYKWPTRLARIRAESSVSMNPNRKTSESRVQVLIVSHPDNFLEVFAQKHVDIRIVRAPITHSAEAERAVEDYIEQSLPPSWRGFYFPGNVRKTELLRPLSLATLADGTIVDGFIDALNQLQRSRESESEGRRVWTF